MSVKLVNPDLFMSLLYCHILVAFYKIRCRLRKLQILLQMRELWRF